MSSVDVIVPCYKYGHYLRECVESVLAQSGPDLRVLIIDDTSPDNTAAVATDLACCDSRVTFVRHARNLGHIRTYNEGIEWASADYMLILSADDYLLPGALRRAVACLDARDDVGFICGKGLELTDDCNENKANFIEDSTAAPDWRILTGVDFIRLSPAINIVSTPTAVVRTKLQKRLGGYRPELPHSGDMEMWFRLAAHASVGITEAYQAVYRRHRENMSLAYTVRGYLPDLHQRKLALEYFFETCGHRLPGANALRREGLRALSYCAVALASTAFNQRNAAISSQLSAFALEICPNIRWSLAWSKLDCKRLIGARAWFALRPIVNLMRQVGA